MELDASRRLHRDINHAPRQPTIPPRLKIRTPTYLNRIDLPLPPIRPLDSANRNFPFLPPSSLIIMPK